MTIPALGVLSERLSPRHVSPGAGLLVCGVGSSVTLWGGRVLAASRFLHVCSCAWPGAQSVLFEELSWVCGDQRK